MTALAPDRHTPASIEALLAEFGAPPVCYLVSESASLDGAELSLHEALLAVIGSGCGTVIICQPGRLAFYEGEDPERRFVLRATAA